jgi:hypothetical protein
MGEKQTMKEVMVVYSDESVDYYKMDNNKCFDVELGMFSFIDGSYVAYVNPDMVRSVQIKDVSRIGVYDV